MEYTEQEMDELEELDNQQQWNHIMELGSKHWSDQLDEDALAIEDFLLLSETKWQKIWRLIKEEGRRWV